LEYELFENDKPVVRMGHIAVPGVAEEKAE